MFIPEEYMADVVSLEEAVTEHWQRFFVAPQDMTLWRDEATFNTFAAHDGSIYKGYSYRLFVSASALVASSSTTARTCMIDVREDNMLVATVRQKSLPDILRNTFSDTDIECDELHVGDQLVLKNEKRGRHHA